MCGEGVRCSRVEVTGVKDPIPPMPFLQRHRRKSLPCGRASTASLTFSSVSWLVKGPWSSGNKEEGVEREGEGRWQLCGYKRSWPDCLLYLFPDANVG